MSAAGSPITTTLKNDTEENNAMQVFNILALSASNCARKIVR